MSGRFQRAGAAVQQQRRQQRAPVPAGLDMGISGSTMSIGGTGLSASMSIRPAAAGGRTAVGGSSTSGGTSGAKTGAVSMTHKPRPLPLRRAGSQTAAAAPAKPALAAKPTTVRMAVEENECRTAAASDKESPLLQTSDTETPLASSWSALATTTTQQASPSQAAVAGVATEGEHATTSFALCSTTPLPIAVWSKLAAHITAHSMALMCPCSRSLRACCTADGPWERHAQRDFGVGSADAVTDEDDYQMTGWREVYMRLSVSRSLDSRISRLESIHDVSAPLLASASAKVKRSSSGPGWPQTLLLTALSSDAAAAAAAAAARISGAVEKEGDGEKEGDVKKALAQAVLSLDVLGNFTTSDSADERLQQMYGDLTVEQAFDNLAMTPEMPWTTPDPSALKRIVAELKSILLSTPLSDLPLTATTNRLAGVCVTALNFVHAFAVHLTVKNQLAAASELSESMRKVCDFKKESRPLRLMQVAQWT